jgi:hypothetical protein
LFTGYWILLSMMFREEARMHWEVSLYSILQIAGSQCVCASPLLIENPDTFNRLSFSVLCLVLDGRCCHMMAMIIYTILVYLGFIGVLVSADTAVWFMLPSYLCLPSSSSATLLRSFLWRTLLLRSSTVSIPRLLAKK